MFGRLFRNTAFQFLIAALVAVFLGFALVSGLEKSIRWTIYLMVVPFGFIYLLLVRNPAVYLIALFFPLFLLERGVIAFRLVGPFSICVSIVVFTVIVISMRLKNVPLPRLGKYGWLWALFVGFTFLNVLPDIRDYSNIVRRFQTLYLEGFLYFWLGLAIWRELNDVRHFMWILFALGAVLCLCQTYYFVTGIPILQSGKQAGDMVTYWRYGGPLANPNTLADFYALLMPGLVVGAVLQRRWIPRLLFLAGVGVAVVFIFLTGSRGGLLSGGFAVLLTFVALLATRTSGREVFKRAIVVQLAVAFIVGAYLVAEIYFSKFMDLSLDRMQTLGFVDVRTELWVASMDIIAEYPFGLGFSHAEFGHEVGGRLFGLQYVIPHNIFLGIAVHAGIHGLVIFLALLFTLFSEGLRAVRLSIGLGNTEIVLFPLLAVSVFITAGMTEPVYQNGHQLNHLFWFLAGTLVWCFRHLKSLSQEQAAWVPSASPVGYGRGESPCSNAEA